MLKTYNVQDKVTLFYNDYNTYFGIQQTLNLVNFINKDEPEKICGGIGMQSHVDIKVPTIELYGTCIGKIPRSRLRSSDYRTGCNDQLRYKRLLFLRRRKETNADQAKYVGRLMKTILEKNRSRDKNVNPKGVTGITLWGLYDTISWRASCSPLLLTRESRIRKLLSMNLSRRKIDGLRHNLIYTMSKKVL